VQLIEWPDYDQADAFRLNKVINEPDFLPLHVVRQLAQAATLVRVQRGKLVATPLGKSILSDARRGSLLAVLFHFANLDGRLSYKRTIQLHGSTPEMKRGLCFAIIALLGLLARVAMAMDNNWRGVAFGCVAAGCLFVMAVV
jgi:hypothetical protein